MPWLLASAVSCHKEPAPPQCGISITTRPEQIYSEETVSAATQSLSDLLTAYSDLLPASVAKGFRERIPNLSVRLEEILRAEGIAQADYTAFFSALDRDRASYAKLLYHVTGNGVSADEQETLRSFLSLLFTHFGASSIEGILRGLIDCKFDYTVEYNLKVAGDYPNLPPIADRYRRLAEETKEKKAIFDGISDSAFAAVSRAILLCSGAFLLSELNPDLLTSFSDAEISSIVRSIDFDISLSEAEWKVLYEQLRVIGVIDTFYEATVAVGNFAEVSTLFNDLFAFLTSIKRDVTPEVVALLRAAPEDDVFGVVLTHLSDETKEKLERLDAVKMSGADYRSAIENSGTLKEFFDVPTATAAQLYVADTNDAAVILRGILRGMFYD